MTKSAGPRRDGTGTVPYIPGRDDGFHVDLLTTDGQV